MKCEIADLICGALDDAGLEYTRHDEYSGRGMYGETTVGVVVADLTILMAGVFAVGCDLGDGFPATTDEMRNALTRLRTDNMGRDIIVY